MNPGMCHHYQGNERSWDIGSTARRVRSVLTNSGAKYLSDSECIAGSLLTLSSKSPGAGLTGWKSNRYNGLSMDLVLPSTSVTPIWGELMMAGNALLPASGLEAQSK